MKNAVFNKLINASLLMVVLALVTTALVRAPEIMLASGSGLKNTEVEIPKAGAFPRYLIDPIGRRIRLDKPPERIVSAILAGDEMLTRLVDPTRITSITYLSDDAGISNVSGIYDKAIPRNYGTVEEIIRFQPDLVIVAGYSNAVMVDMLMATDIPVVRFANFSTYDDISDNLTMLAQALGNEDQARQWLLETDARVQHIRQQVDGLDRPRVLYYNTSGFTSGIGTAMDDSIRWAGGYNVIADLGMQGYTRITREMAIALQPDVVLLSDWPVEDAEALRNRLLNDPAWQIVPAVQQGRVYSLTGAWLTSGSPYRVKGVEDIARLLHPESNIIPLSSHTLIQEENAP